MQVIIKFMPDHGHFKHERLFYENRQALEGEEAAAFIPHMFDAFAGSLVIDTEDDDAIPPSLVLERGTFLLGVKLCRCRWTLPVRLVLNKSEIPCGAW